MAADAYVQSAAGHLENAANALKMEADRIRGELMTAERELTHAIDSASIEMQTHSAEAAITKDQNERMKLEMRIRQVQSEIQNKKAELDKTKRDMQQKIKDKESAMNDLMGKARGLYNQAASLR